MAKRWLLPVLLTCCFLSGCQKETASLIEAKWQLREMLFMDGTKIRVDSIFYNFQKGTFSAIRMRSNDEYKSFMGSYVLNGVDELTINLHLKEGELEEIPDDIGWDSEEKRFRVESISTSDMCLSSDNKKYLFRKY